MALLIHQLQTGGHAKAALHGKPKKMPNPWLAPARGLFAALVYLLAVGILLGAVTQLVDWVNRVLPFSDLANGISTVLLAPILVWTAFGLMVLTSLILPSVRGMCRMHAAEHKVIAAFESYGPEWARFSHDMDKEHIRCGTTNVSLIVMMIAAIDAVLAIWIADPALRFGAALVYVPFVDGLVVQLLTWPATRYAISRPGRFLQKLTTLHPEQQHMDLAHKGFAPLAVELERNN